MSVRLPRLLASAQIADNEGKPSLTFVRYWQSFAEQIERAINAIATILGITDQLDQALSDAQAAIAVAQAAADTAQVAADAAATAAADQAREQALINSGIDPLSVLTATPTVITIASHTRKYGDGVSVAVNGGSVAASAPADIDYVSYDDPMRTGGAVTYIVGTTAPIQTGSTHVVGAVTIPITGTTNGGRGPTLPGYVEP